MISGIRKCKNQELPQWSDGFIERLDKLIAKRLRQNDSYQKLKLDEEQILLKNPNIMQLIDGGANEGEITLSVNEKKALENLVTLKMHMDTYREQVIYIIRQVDLVKYFSMLIV